MELYHSSYTSVERPDIGFSRNFLDFGRGFYLTSLYDQAVQYAQRFKRRNQSAWLSTYEFEYEPEEWRKHRIMSETDLALRAEKNTAIIIALTELFGIPMEEAVSKYFQSDTARLIEDKVADLHCRSPKYLATLVWEEYQ